MTAGSARRVWAVVPAAGQGLRFDSPVYAGTPKQYVPLRGATVIEWSLSALLAEPRLTGVVVALARDDAHWPSIAKRLDGRRLVTAVGGANRQESVLNGLEALGERAAADDWVLVHDAARPCLTRSDLSQLLDALADIAPDDGRLAGAILASPVVDTVKRELDGSTVETVDRRGLWRALTPQAFGFARLKAALREASALPVAATDEAQAMERHGFRARLIHGSSFNIKVTRPEDLAAAEAVLAQAEARGAVIAENGVMRIGQGFDVHTFGEGDHVMLGGVRIAHRRGVVAHSDGDVVIHALCDAVLGALGLGDIGQHFPDTDPRFRGADSRVFLREVAAKMRAAGLRLVNADVTVLAEAPRVAAHRAAMAANLAADLGASPALINIKATTTERLGFVGREEGLAAQAAVLLGA